MPGVIAELRAVCPHRSLTLGEGLRVAELQANRLLEAAEIREPAVPDAVVTNLPRVTLERVGRIPVSGSVRWSKGLWVIALNRHEPRVRQRFSLAHELKHVLDAPFGEALYPSWRGLSADDRAEQVANHFAACLLMPKAWVRRAYFNQGITNLPRLAARFEVSQTAMRYRLESLGMVPPIVRCGIREAA
jgi:IrrE N-terminal-like domain